MYNSLEKNKIKNLNREKISNFVTATKNLAEQDFIDEEEAGINLSKSQNPSTAAVVFSRDEMNLAEFPLAVLSTRNDPKIKTLEFTDHLRSKEGELIERKWIITGADKFGLPTSTDDDVVLGLIRLSMLEGFRDRKIYFTRYELLKALQWSTEGRNYSRLTKSLDRLSGVRIRASNSFYDNSTKSYQTCNFGIIDSYEINDNRSSKNNETAKSFFIWSEMIFESFRSGFIKKIDLDLYFKLKSAVSRRLYRYLDKHFYYRNTVERPLLNFAFEKLGLSRSYKYVSSIRQQIEPAAEELIEVGFLSKYEVIGKGELTQIRFIAANQAVVNPSLANQTNRNTTSSEKPEAERGIQQREISQNQGTSLSNTNSTFKSRETNVTPSIFSRDESRATLRNEIFEAIVSRGIAITQAKRLLEQKTERDLLEIDRILQYYDFLVENNDQKISKNKVGFLYRAVENPFRFTVPVSFKNQKAAQEQEKSAENNNSRNSKRPELKIFSSQETNSQLQKERKDISKYQDFIDRELAQKISLIAQIDIDNINEKVEAKMSCLKSVLSAERFKEAHNSCVREELIKKLNIIDYKTWLSNKQ